MARTATARKRTPDPRLERASPGPTAHEAVRIASLKSLIEELRGAQVDSRPAFGKLFAKAQRVLELDDFVVSRALQISRPTVGRWARGESAPHPLGRRPALLWLAREASQRLKQYG